jgi:sugar transferase (PEP-CTERM/EpsH1 system associated)
MRILYVVPYPPSLVRVRPFQMIRHLTKRGHSLTVATAWTNDREHSDVEELARHAERIVARRLPIWRYAWNTVRVLPTKTSLQAVYAWEPGLASQIQALARTGEFDVVHVEHLRGACYALALKPVLDHLEPQPPLVWDSVDSISHLYAQAVQQTQSMKWRLLTRMELPRTRLMERKLASRSDRVLVTSQADRAAFEDLLREDDGTCPVCKRLCVISNGVDTDYFTPGEKERDPDTVILSGKMSYHANVTAALHLVREIMPHVWRKRPATCVQIVGQRPPRAVRRLALRHPDRVSVTGAVDDLPPYLRSAQVAVAPILYGAGIQNKVLEAMSCGTAVVASPSAVSGLSAVCGRDLLVAETPETFAEAIVSVLDQPRYGRELGQSGRQYVEQHHSWDKIVGDLEAVYTEAASEMGLRRPNRTGLP